MTDPVVYTGMTPGGDGFRVTVLPELPIPVGTFNLSFLTWMASLPITLPATPGVAWNNSGIPSVSQP